MNDEQRQTRILELEAEKAENEARGEELSNRIDELYTLLSEAESEEHDLSNRYWDIVDELEALGAE
jgi:hypothetical protein